MHLCLDTGISYLAHGSITMTPYLFPICRPLTSRSMTWLLCSGHRFFVIPYWHMKVSPWDNESHTFMTSVWPLPLASISKLYFHHEFVWTRLSLLYDVGIPNLAHRMFCTFMTFVWPLTSRLILAHFFHMDMCGWVNIYVGGEDILASALYLNENSEHQ